MTRLEKIQLQQKNKGVVLLFKEGFFYKAYNEGAFLLRHFDFKVQENGKGVLKAVYVGFPNTVFERIKVEFVVTESQTHLLLKSTQKWDEALYLTWVQEQQKQLNVKNLKKPNQWVRKELQNYPIATKSPIEVFAWVAGLQEKLVTEQ
jgi:hypothetical protein